MVPDELAEGCRVPANWLLIHCGFSVELGPILVNLNKGLVSARLLGVPSLSPCPLIYTHMREREGRDRESETERKTESKSFKQSRKFFHL